MKEYYYYLRDPDFKPIVTVCLLKKKLHKVRSLSIRPTTVIARGISICSELDHPSKKIGRAIAKGRAAKAFAVGCSYGKIVRSGTEELQYVFGEFKGTLNPKLTEYEKRILNIKE